MKLHQVIAVIQSVKSGASKKKTAVYQLAQKAGLFKGLSRTYQPRDEEGYIYPSESQNLQYKATDLIEKFIQASEELFNLCATQDWANTRAKANVIVDGQTLLEDVPVPFLLFLEKQLIDIKTFVGSLPVLSSDQVWQYQNNVDCYAAEPKQTAKTKKITKPVVLYEATKEHPAQVKEASEDVVEGTWTTINYSGALPQSQINEMLKKVEKLQKAVVIAREEANGLEVERKRVAQPIFDSLFNTN